MNSNLRCKVCNSGEIRRFLTLGNIPPVNAFIDSSEISKPKEGVAKKLGGGKNLRKNLLNEFLNIIILYDIWIFIAITLRARL